MKRYVRDLTLLRPWGGFTPAYDPFATSIVHAYEPARRVLSSYTGSLVRLRRASDNAEADFGYLGNGDLDVAAIAAWAGGASYVVTVYDQAPARDNVTQGVAANQPLYVASIQNGHAGMRLDGTNDYLQGTFTTGGALSQPISIYAAAQLDATVINDDSVTVIADGLNGAARNVLYKNGATAPDSWAIYAGVVQLQGGNADANWHVWSTLFNGAASQLWIDTVSQVVGNAGVWDIGGAIIGSRWDTTGPWKGDIVSVIITDPSLSDAQRVGMQGAMNAYWGVF